MKVSTVEDLAELMRVAFNDPNDMVRIDAIRQLLDIAEEIDVDGEDQ